MDGLGYYTNKVGLLTHYRSEFLENLNVLKLLFLILKPCGYKWEGSISIY